MDSCISMKSYRGKIFLYIVLQFIKAGLLLLPPYCYLLFLNEVITKKRIGWLWGVVALYVAVFAVKALVSVLIKQVYNRIFPAMTLEAKNRVLEKYNELDVEVLARYTAGELKERLHKDTENAVLYWEKRLELWVAAISVPVMTGILFYLNWILAAVSFLLLPLSFYITRTIKSKSNLQHERRREILGKYNDFMIHNMFFWKEVKSNCQEERQQQQFEGLWKELGDAFLKSHIFWFLNRTFLAFKDVFLTKMGLYLLGGILVIQEMATVPALLAFMEYYGDFVNRLLQISDIYMQRGEQEASLKRLKEIMELQSPERPYGLEHFESVEFCNIGFSYGAGRKNILRDCNLKIERGETVAIKGESGCGKSTVAAVLMGRNRGCRGSVKIGGRELADIRESERMKNITYVSHQSYLFKGTVRENLRMGKPDASDQELWEVLERVNLADFLRSEGRLDTRLTEKASNLSGGQRQRLALARALLHDSPVYIFDEATSNIDMESENDIMREIHALTERKTVILISHRLANVTASDNIYVMHAGNVAESGGHEELLARGGIYAKLWNTQQSLENYGKDGADI